MHPMMGYFSDDVTSTTGTSVGAEIETQFIDQWGTPITTETSQKMLRYLSGKSWRVAKTKGNLLTELVDAKGNRLLYELGRHNIELATAAHGPHSVLGSVRVCLEQLYQAGEFAGALPYFAPILITDEDLLVVPDERDATWLRLDGREALAPLARTSSVQFTISVSPKDAIPILNELGYEIATFLSDYPQDEIWKRYIANSRAKYLPDRYGGPLRFRDLNDYCRKLFRHDVVQGDRLVPLPHVANVDESIFVRSVWWHFRLRRYGSALCIEVRPLPRRSDDHIETQFSEVMNFF